MPKISELDHLFRPVANSILEKGLTLRQSEIAFRVVLVCCALEKNKKRHDLAAAALDCSPTVISNAIRGKGPMRKPNARVKPWDVKHGGTPSEVLGRLEV